MDSQSQNHYLVVYPWGISMVIFGPYDWVYKPYQNQPGFWVWPTILENQMQPPSTHSFGSPAKMATAATARREGAAILAATRGQSRVYLVANMV